MVIYNRHKEIILCPVDVINVVKYFIDVQRYRFNMLQEWFVIETFHASVCNFFSGHLRCVHPGCTGNQVVEVVATKPILTLPEKHFGLLVIITSTREGVSVLKHVAPVTRLVNPKISHVSDSTFGPRRLQFMSPKTRRCCHLLGNIHITLTWNQRKLHH